MRKNGQADLKNLIVALRNIWTRLATVCVGNTARYITLYTELQARSQHASGGSSIMTFRAFPQSWNKCPVLYKNPPLDYVNYTQILFFFWRNSPPLGQGLLIHEVSRSHSTTHHSREESFERVISPLQRPLPDNIQQSNLIIHIFSRLRNFLQSHFSPEGKVYLK